MPEPTEPATDAYAQGYAEAVARLRDDARYLSWWSSSGVQPDGPIRRHLADYLETVGATEDVAARDLTGSWPITGAEDS